MASFLTRVALFLCAATMAAAAGADRTRFDHSILAVPGAADPAHPRRGRIARTALRPEETAAAVHFEVALRMRNFAELQDRLAHGEQISGAEMARRYFPAAGDERRVVQWLTAQGLTVERTDSNHLAVFGRGSVALAQTAFQTTFARVATPDGEFTSAIAAPSLPADFAAAVAGIHGLQPHLRPRPLLNRRPVAGATADAANSIYLPAQILAAYNATGLGLTGSGQTIAIFSNAYPAGSDLSAFWIKSGVAASSSNIIQVDIEAGPGASPSADAVTEADLDVEWASSLAPNAKIRVYGSSENDEAGWDLTFQQVYADLPSNPTMHVFSISFGGNELDVDQDFLVIESQYVANLASAGVTVLAASGDGGSSPPPDNIVQASYPATDPNVTGVGGTSLVLDTGNNVTSETGWTDSGGGTSVYYARPAWQTGPGVPAGNFRLMPDISATADPNHGASVIDGGSVEVIGGTSWATPVWGAFCALINESRAKTGAGPLGALNPRLYPLGGTSAFRDITSGSNGRYSATTGYDEVTGLGVPNLSVLVQSALTGAAPLIISDQLPAVITVLGQPATFAVTASGTGPFAYQWQRRPGGSTTWSNLTDGGAYSGTAAAMMVISASTYAQNGDAYRCVVANASGSVTGNATPLTVNPSGVTTLAGWPYSAGRTDGTGWGARFDFIGGVIVDSSGNVVVADAGGSTIRRITPAGVVTTFAGLPGTASWQDGTGSAAHFNGPAGVAMDSMGNFYIPDAGDFTVRKVTPAGAVTTLAGSPNASSLSTGTGGGELAAADGSGGAARFADPEAIAADNQGNIYVADGAGNAIRKVTPQGVVTTLAGGGAAGSANGTGAAAQFSNPLGVAVDGSYNVYVSDSGNNLIRMITPAGVVSTLAGSTTAGSRNGTGTAARFNFPAGMRVDSSGNVYVADSGNSIIRMITPAGVVTTVAGVAGDADNADGPAATALFSGPGDLALGAGGLIYVGDSENFTIRRIAPGAVSAPQIVAQPASLNASVGDSVSFTVTLSAASSQPLTYQWQLEAAGASSWTALTDGGAYSGSATATLAVSPMAAALAGNQYRCVVTNNVGNATSSAATLSLTAPPAIGASDQSGGVALGGSVTLISSAIGGGLSYQWLFNGASISGATGSTLTLTNFSSANVGTYSITVTNSRGSATANIATLAIGAAARLLNLSARSTVVGANGLTAGFVIGGTGTKTVLLRGIGPTLGTAFGIAGSLADPALTLSTLSGVQLNSNAAWGGTATLSAAFAQTGAFALPPASLDDALLVSLLPPGNYTAAVTSVSGGTGAALDEIYEADSGTPTTRLINLSVRATVTPSSALIAGFVIGPAGGTAKETVLIRGIGPTLASFGVAGVLANPVLTVNSGPTVLATNTSWTANATTTEAQFQALFTQVSAFALPSAGSNDCAVELSLPPGNYTAQVTGAGSTSGAALIEIYEVSP